MSESEVRVWVFWNTAIAPNSATQARLQAYGLEGNQLDLAYTETATSLFRTAIIAQPDALTKLTSVSKLDDNQIELLLGRRITRISIISPTSTEAIGALQKQIARVLRNRPASTAAGVKNYTSPLPKLLTSLNVERTLGLNTRIADAQTSVAQDVSLTDEVRQASNQVTGAVRGTLSNLTSALFGLADFISPAIDKLTGWMSVLGSLTASGLDAGLLACLLGLGWPGLRTLGINVNLSNVLGFSADASDLLRDLFGYLDPVISLLGRLLGKICVTLKFMKGMSGVDPAFADFIACLGAPIELPAVLKDMIGAVLAGISAFQSLVLGLLSFLSGLLSIAFGLLPLNIGFPVRTADCDDSQLGSLMTDARNVFNGSAFGTNATAGGA